MTLQQLEYFLAAAAHRSFSAAAQALHMAQPSLSEQIRRLEAELGSPLFIRGRPRPRADRGGPAAAAARRAHARRRAGGRRLRARGARAAPAARRRSAPSATRPTTCSPTSCRTSARATPTCACALVGQNSSEVADAVRDGQLEAGLIVLPIDDRGLDVQPAIDDELLYLSADPERVREPMTIERLAEAPLILYDARFGWADPTRRQLAERAQRAGVTLEPEIEVEYVEAALDLAARGLGDTIGDAPHRARRAASRGACTASRSTRRSYDTFAFITRRNAHLSPATRAFMELAASGWRRSAAGLERGLAIDAMAATQHRRRGGVPPDHLLAAGGGAADDRRQRRARDAALGADRARDGRPARARRLHHARRRQVDLASPTTGASTPRRVVRRHRLIERFLTDVLGIPWDDVHEEAERLEHAMSPVLEARMLAAIGDAKTCPHGHPIEPGTRIEGVPLADCEPGATIKILRFENEAEDLLHYLKRRGPRAGAARARRRAPTTTRSRSSSTGRTIALTRSVAETVSVRRRPVAAAAHRAARAARARARTATGAERPQLSLLRRSSGSARRIRVPADHAAPRARADARLGLHHERRLPAAPRGAVAARRSTSAGRCTAPPGCSARSGGRSATRSRRSPTRSTSAGSRSRRSRSSRPCWPAASSCSA